jgi:hypothetical protein
MVCFVFGAVQINQLVRSAIVIKIEVFLKTDNWSLMNPSLSFNANKIEQEHDVSSFHVCLLFFSPWLKPEFQATCIRAYMFLKWQQGTPCLWWYDSCWWTILV